MKAKLDVNAETIKKALLQYFANLQASEVHLNAVQSRGWNDQLTGGFDVSATVTIDVSGAVAQ